MTTATATNATNYADTARQVLADPAKRAEVFATRPDLVERIRQLAPEVLAEYADELPADDTDALDDGLAALESLPAPTPSKPKPANPAAKKRKAKPASKPAPQKPKQPTITTTITRQSDHGLCKVIKGKDKGNPAVNPVIVSTSHDGTLYNRFFLSDQQFCAIKRAIESGNTHHSK